MILPVHVYVHNSKINICLHYRLELYDVDVDVRHNVKFCVKWNGLRKVICGQYVTCRGYIRNIRLVRKHDIAAYSICLSQSNFKIYIRGRIMLLVCHLSHYCEWFPSVVLRRPSFVNIFFSRTTGPIFTKLCMPTDATRYPIPGGIIWE